MKLFCSRVTLMALLTILSACERSDMNSEQRLLQDTVTIDVIVDGTSGDSRLMVEIPDKDVYTVIELENHRSEIQIPLGEVVLARFEHQHEARSYSFSSYIEPGHVVLQLRVNGERSTVDHDVGGSDAQDLYEAYMQFIRGAPYGDNDSFVYYTDLTDREHNVNQFLRLAEDNFESRVTVDAMRVLLRQSPRLSLRIETIRRLVELYRRIGGDDKLTQDLDLNRIVQLAQRREVGQPFVQSYRGVNEDGLAVTLDDYLGNGYVLLEFWATWCPPCLAELSHIAQLKEKFPKLTVVMISLDDDERQWKSAIERYSLEHHDHIADFSRGGFAMAEYYDLIGIPQNIIVDDQRRIVANNVMGPALDSTLNRLYSN